MFDLTRQEKIILIFLSLTFVIGLGITRFKKSQTRLELSIQPSKLDAARIKAEEFIAAHRWVNINTSNVNELTRLPGVGEKIARRIVEYHRLHGPFKSKQELLHVQGIGEKKFAQIKDSITLK